MNNFLLKLNQQWSDDLLLTNPSHLQQLENNANQLFSEIKTIDQLLLFEKESDLHLGVQLATKLALSKKIVANLKDNIFVSIVFAMYGEHNRILNSDQHPNGEDFLNRKLEQLQWLFNDYDNIGWEMIAVDDGCPNGSGKIAQKILGDENKVLFLQDGIDDKHKATLPLTNTNDSRKGGSIAYGMAKAIESNKNAKHIVVFTDADLSTHLGQTGLLLNSILNNNKSVAIGSRREENSVVIKKGLRNTRGKMFIYLWKRLLPQLNYIIDTQCGFKAFESNLLRKIVYDMEEKKFAFDIELLLKTELINKNKIEKVGIAWIDSDAESTTGGSTYLDMLHSIAGFYRKYLEPDSEADEWAKYIEDLDQKKWDYLLDNMPAVIENAVPSNLGSKLIELSDLKEV